MSGTTMLVVIVCVVSGVLYKMYNRYLEFKSKTLNQNKAYGEENDQLAIQVTKLTERVQVLEKIVTDEGYQVQKDIKNL